MLHHAMGFHGVGNLAAKLEVDPLGLAVRGHELHVLLESILRSAVFVIQIPFSLVFTVDYHSRQSAHTGL